MRTSSSLSCRLPRPRKVLMLSQIGISPLRTHNRPQLDCTIFYVAAAVILTGMVPFGKLVNVADSLAAALSHVNQGWAVGILAFGAVAAMTAVLLCFQLGQPRILMAMSRDGFLGPWFAKIH